MTTKKGFHLLEEQRWEETGTLPRMVRDADGNVAPARPKANTQKAPALPPTPPLPED